MVPHFRCSTCFAEFEETSKDEIVDIRMYTADYAPTWRLADRMFPVRALNSAYTSRSVQHSIGRLDPYRLQPILRQYLDMSPWTENPDGTDPAGGYRTSLGKTRLGQQRFREEMLDRFQNTCAFTGRQPPESLEAAHLYGYCKSPRHDLRGGLLLRRDLHSLFDRGLITVNTKNWTIEVSPRLDQYPELHALQGMPLKVPTDTRPSERYLDNHADALAAPGPSSGRQDLECPSAHETAD
jgi:hypothetical protein